MFIVASVGKFEMLATGTSHTLKYNFCEKFESSVAVTVMQHFPTVSGVIVLSSTFKLDDNSSQYMFNYIAKSREHDISGEYFDVVHIVLNFAQE